MLDGLDGFLARHLHALDVRARRSEVLASNIANADTPNYKARDFDFAAALRGAQAGRGELALMRTSARHLSQPHASAAAVDLQYRVPVQASIDGNTVEMDTELAQFSDNALRMQADITFLSSRVRSMQIAINGQ
ncbi:MAG: flagellar basal body rod protein FlgB [Burkholderiales bacterium]|nr:flagellar basal body rod protein FlgB [Burkholderiales bacterium]